MAAGDTQLPPPHPGAPLIWVVVARTTVLGKDPAIFARAGPASQVRDSPSSDYQTPARRPANSRLDCSRIARDFGIARPDWRADLDRVLNQVGYTA